MEIISQELSNLLEDESDKLFEDNGVIQELVLPMLEKWTNIVMFSTQHEAAVLSKCWKDLYTVLERLPSSALSFSISRTEYLVDILLQHIQNDIYENDIETWKISAKCFLIFLENCGTVVWQETISRADEIFDNLVDIYQSTDVSRVIEQNASFNSLGKDTPQVVIVIELMMAMALKPLLSTSQCSANIIAGCISDLLSHFNKLQILNSGEHSGEHSGERSEVSKPLKGEELSKERNNFIEIVEFYLTDTTKNCRTHLLSAAQTASKKSRNDSGNDSDEMDSDEVEKMRITKSLSRNSFSCMKETLSMICVHKDLMEFPEIYCHILSCHSHLCIVPEVKLFY
jgi:hypothetical protein